MHGGFYFLIRKDYDKYLKVVHSNRPNMDVGFVKNIEPGAVNVLDCSIVQSEE